MGSDKTKIAGTKKYRRVSSRKLITSGIRRRFFRNVATIACFAFISGIILSAGFLVAGAESGVQAGLDRLGADVYVIPLDPWARNSGFFMTGRTSELYFDLSMTDDIRSTPGVASASPETYVGHIDNVSWCEYSVLVLGYEPETDFVIHPLLVEPTQSPQSNGEVIVGSLVDRATGDTLELYGHEYVIHGKMETTGFAVDNSVFLTLDDAFALARESENWPTPLTLKDGDISAVLVRVDRAYGTDKAVLYISSLNPGTLAFPMSRLGEELTGQLVTTSQMLYLTITSVILVSLPLVALIAIMGANERRREIGILRALGGTRSFIFRLFFSETVFLAFIGSLLGVIGASLALYLFQDIIIAALQTTFVWPSIMVVLGQITLALLVSVGLAGMAALWPAYRASIMEPYDAIRRGQN
jgi:putative ABC transport system permease protein